MTEREVVIKITVTRQEAALIASACRLQGDELEASAHDVDYDEAFERRRDAGQLTALAQWIDGLLA